MSEKAVSNSSCLIALEKIGRLDVLANSFTSLTIPPAVQDEIGRSFDWLNVQQIQNTAVADTLKIQVGDGESEAIALAMEMDDVILVLDDKKARRIAKQLGLKVIGTVGLLLRAKKKGIVAEVKPVLNALQNAGFRITDSLYEKGLQLANEA